MNEGVGISGMGRIGRLLTRKLLGKGGGRRSGYPILKAINSTYPVETIAHLLKYDTVHGKWDATISCKGDTLLIDGHPVQVAYSREPEAIPWQKFGVSLAIDATGKFNDREGAMRHISAGADSVLITAPGKRMDLTVVMGVNDTVYNPGKHKLLSAASCTTNCVAPLLAVLDEAFAVESGWMTTVHAFTSDQNHLDNPHKDLRRARACTQSIIPTTTGIGKALADVLPHLSASVEGISLRVPTQDVSLVDLTVTVGREARTEDVKETFRRAAAGKLGRYLGYNEEPLVSSDYIGCPHSAVVDGLSVSARNDQIKVIAWYDNEWAYACRVVDLAALVLEKRGAESSAGVMPFAAGSR